MANINNSIQGHLDRKGIAYTVTANGTATLAGTLTHNQLEELRRNAEISNYDLVVTSGTLTLQRR